MANQERVTVRVNLTIDLDAYRANYGGSSDQEDIQAARDYASDIIAEIVAERFAVLGWAEVTSTS